MKPYIIDYSNDPHAFSYYYKDKNVCLILAVDNSAKFDDIKLTYSSSENTSVGKWVSNSELNKDSQKQFFMKAYYKTISGDTKLSEVKIELPIYFFKKYHCKTQSNNLYKGFYDAIEDYIENSIKRDIQLGLIKPIKDFYKKQNMDKSDLCNTILDFALKYFYYLYYKYFLNDWCMSITGYNTHEYYDLLTKQNKISKNKSFMENVVDNLDNDSITNYLWIDLQTTLPNGKKTAISIQYDKYENNEIINVDGYKIPAKEWNKKGGYHLYNERDEMDYIYSPKTRDYWDNYYDNELKRTGEKTFGSYYEHEDRRKYEELFRNHFIYDTAKELKLNNPKFKYRRMSDTLKAELEEESENILNNMPKWKYEKTLDEWIKKYKYKHEQDENNKYLINNPNRLEQFGLNPSDFDDEELYQE